MTTDLELIKLVTVKDFENFIDRTVCMFIENLSKGTRTVLRALWLRGCGIIEKDHPLHKILDLNGLY